MYLTVIIVAAGFFGCSSVMLDAMGSHALPHWLGDNPASPALIASWGTAVRTQMLHAVLLVGLAALQYQMSRFWRAATLLTLSVGMLLFCGSIYIKVLFDLPEATKVAPTGGVLLMIGWVTLTLGIMLRRPHSP